MVVTEPVDSAGADPANMLSGHHLPDDLVKNHCHCDPNGYHVPTLCEVVKVVDKGTAAARSVGNLGLGLRKKTMFLGDVENATIAGVANKHGASVLPLLAGNMVDGWAKLDAAVAGSGLDATGMDGNPCYVNGILPLLLTTRGTAVRSR